MRSDEDHRRQHGHEMCCPGPGGPASGDMGELRRRLRKLYSRPNRRLPDQRIPHTPSAPPRPTPQRPMALEEAVAGVEVSATESLRAYLISCTPRQADGSYEQLAEALRHTLARRQSGLCQALRSAGVRAPAVGQRLLFVDLETTGLGSTPLFLVGTMTWDGQSLAVDQYLARDYTEEAAVISLFAQRAADSDVLVSFNGKAFDLPYLRIRAAATRVPLSADLPHLDLLHESRRAWRAALPDCRLQTLEQYLLGRRREGDIPGRLIPEAYHVFVRTGNAATLAVIVRHNLLDLLTMAELMVRLP